MNWFETKNYTKLIQITNIKISEKKLENKMI